LAVAGVDIGSRTIGKVVLEKGKIVEAEVVDSGSSPLERAARLLGDKAYFDKIVATGYGRHAARARFAHELITEIKAHALGARYFFPSCRTVLDIGGQDSKVILLAEDGRVVDFLMNDKCAAGTGKFLEIMGGSLGISLENLVAIASTSPEELRINSMCAVFAESEVVSLLTSGAAVSSVAKAVLNSICDRIGAFLGRVGPRPPVAFTGGVAGIPGFAQFLSERLNLSAFLVPPNPQIIGALGAALYAEGERNDV
jgi:predicted CoA-substrate-specific enzyme activase